MNLESIDKNIAKDYLNKTVFNNWKYIGESNKLFATYQNDNSRCDIYDNALLANVLIMLYEKPSDHAKNILDFLTDLYNNDNGLIKAAFPDPDKEYSMSVKDVGNNSMVCISFVKFILKYSQDENVPKYKKVLRGILEKIKGMIEICPNDNIIGYKGRDDANYISTEHMIDLYALTKMIINGNLFNDDRFVNDINSMNINCQKFVNKMWYTPFCKKQDIYGPHIINTLDEKVLCDTCVKDNDSSEQIICTPNTNLELDAYATGVNIDNGKCAINYGSYYDGNWKPSYTAQPADTITWNMLAGVDDIEDRKRNSLRFITNNYIVNGGIKFTMRSDCPQLENTGSYLCALFEYKHMFGSIDFIDKEKKTIESMYDNIYNKIINNEIIYATNIGECPSGISWSYFGKEKKLGGHLASTMYCLLACLASKDYTFNIYKYHDNRMSNFFNLSPNSSHTNVCIKKTTLIFVLLLVFLLFVSSCYLLYRCK